MDTRRQELELALQAVSAAGSDRSRISARQRTSLIRRLAVALQDYLTQLERSGAADGQTLAIPSPERLAVTEHRAQSQMA